LRQQAQDDFEGVLRLVADIGFVAVEPAGLHGMDAKVARNLLDELGLGVCSAHAPLPRGESGRASMEEVAVLGTSQVFCSLHPEDFASIEAIDRAVELFADGAALSASLGISLGYHNHWWEFDHLIDDRSPYDLFIEGIGAGAPLEVDLYWVQTGGADPLELVTRLGSRVTHLHVKDGPCDDPEASMTVLGEGVVDLAPLLEASPAPWHVVELDRCDTEMATAVRGSYQYLVRHGLSTGRKA
jgi:sugar phosphate isomerase/epimerase